MFYYVIGYVEEEVKPKEEDPMSTEIIQQLIKDDSDDIKETANEEEQEIVNTEDIEQVITKDTNEEDEDESLHSLYHKPNDKEDDSEAHQPFEEVCVRSESESASPENETTNSENESKLDSPCKSKQEETAEIKHEDHKKKDDDTDVEQEIIEDEELNSEPHKPIIMNRRKSLHYSPSFKPTSKLLGKRQSIDPVRIKACGVSNVPDITKKSTDYVTSEVKIPSISGSGQAMLDRNTRPPSRKEISKPILPPDQPRPFVTTPNPARNRALWEAPNLARLIASNEKSPGKRPDSAQSNSTSTTTTSCTLSLSEADSGVSDLSSGSRRSSGNYACLNSNLTTEHLTI